MAQQFYVKINGNVHGPLTGQKIQEMAQCGQLSPTDEVRVANSQTWHQAENFKGLQFATADVEELPQSSPQEQEEAFSDLRVTIPDPPAYPAISFFIGLYNFFGGLVILFGMGYCVFLLISGSKSGKQSDFLIALVAALVAALITVFAAAFYFFCAQLLALAADSARNLHRLTHSNLLMMQSIVNNRK